jgi:hypothetical protein
LKNEFTAANIGFHRSVHRVGGAKFGGAGGSIPFTASVTANSLASGSAMRLVKEGIEMCWLIEAPF